MMRGATPRTDMNHIILSCSLHPRSRSRILARASFIRMEAAGHDVDFIDLAELSLPQCDGATARRDPDVQKLKARMRGADGILMGVPIYHYGVSSAAKNAVELTGREVWTRKVVGFLCAAGGSHSYMSIMSLCNSLMLDFRAHIVPRFLYACKEDFTGDGAIATAAIAERLDRLVDEFTLVTRAIRSALAVDASNSAMAQPVEGARVSVPAPGRVEAS